jgi:opacity protein-like surface antigen
LDITGGLSSPKNSSVQDSTFTNSFEYKDGFSFSSALGYKPDAQRGFVSHTRGEIAVGYQQAKLDSDGVIPIGGTSGKIHTYSAMLNGYYDFKNATSFVPYVGGGFGVAQVTLEDANRVGISDDSDILPAYQFLAGFSIEPASLPYTSLHLGYRYFSTIGKVELTDNTNNRIQIEQDSHNFEGGIRWHF